MHLRRNDGEGLLRGTVEHKIEQSGGCPPNQETPKSGTLCYHSPLFFKLIYFSWRLMTLQYCSGFCHTLTWISPECTCIPHPEPPSHLPPHPIPQGHPSAPALSTLPHTWNLDWWSVSHMIIYMFQCYSLKSSHPSLLPQTSKVFSLYLCIFCCLAYRVAAI